MYWEWYKYIEDDANNKAIRIEAKVETDIRDRSIQWPKSLITPNRELELNK